MPRLRSRTLVRNLQMVSSLRSGWRSVSGLAREFSVTRRTIYRDLAALQEAHLPIMESEEPPGRYRIVERV